MRLSSWKAISPTTRPSFSALVTLWISEGGGGDCDTGHPGQEVKGHPLLLPVFQDPFQGKDALDTAAAASV